MKMQISIFAAELDGLVAVAESLQGNLEANFLSK